MKHEREGILLRIVAAAHFKQISSVLFWMCTDISKWSLHSFDLQKCFRPLKMGAGNYNIGFQDSSVNSPRIVMARRAENFETRPVSFSSPTYQVGCENWQAKWLAQTHFQTPSTPVECVSWPRHVLFSCSVPQTARNVSSTGKGRNSGNKWNFPCAQLNSKLKHHTAS